ncbi:hypothetical protein AeNC1_018517 [Aphanomyces euteiches]|nr:hypothetical protein AeNC1_018517 [Aphanomyces euteiches]
MLEIRGRLALKNHRFHAEVRDSRLKLQRLFQLRPADILENQPPVDFDGLYLPPISFELDPDDQHIFGIRDIRDVKNVKEYEVQLENHGPWVWIASILLLPSVLVYEFERDRLHLARMSMIRQNEFDIPVEEENVEETKDNDGREDEVGDGGVTAL